MIFDMRVFSVKDRIKHKFKLKDQLQGSNVKIQ